MSADTPECRILDDDELEKQGAFRNWREDTAKLYSARVFGGPSAQRIQQHQRGFPTAFQTYRPEKQGKTFPFHMQKEKGSAVAAAAAAPVTSERPLLSSLQTAVRQSFRATNVAAPAAPAPAAAARPTTPQPINPF